MDLTARTNYLKVANSLQVGTGGEDFNDGILDYLTTGVASSAISAFVGIANTFHSLGTMLGMADEDGGLDTYETIESLLGSDSADFYARHAQGVDAFGLVIGSLVPGGLAVKGLRAAQMAGKIPAPLRAVTGAKNPDIVLGSQAVEAAKQSLLRSGASHFKDPAMYRAYATGLKQNALEAVVFEAATLATMNQHATLNPDQLGYLEAIGQATVDGLPFLIAGGALGAGIDALRIRGAVKKFSIEEHRRTGHLVHPKVGDLVGLTEGDKLYHIAQASALHKTLADSVDPSDWFAVKRYEQGKAELKKLYTKTVTDLNEAGDGARKYLEDLVLNATNEDLQRVASELSGATKISVASNVEALSMQKYFQRTSAPALEIVAEVGEENARAISSAVDRLSDALGNLGIEVTQEQAESLSRGAMRELITSAHSFERAEYARGFAYGVNTTQQELPNIEYVLGFLDGKLSTPFFSGSTHVNKTVIEKNLNYVSNVLKVINNGLEGAGISHRFKIPTLDEFVTHVSLHELAHVKTNKGEFFRTFRNAVGDSPELGELGLSKRYKQIMAELIDLSIEARTVNWRDASSSNFLDPLLTLPAGKRGLVLSDLLQGDSANYSKLTQQLIDNGTISDNLLKSLNNTDGNYMLDPYELFADAGRMLTDKATRQRAAKLAPNLAKALDVSPGITKSWNPAKSYLNVRTGRSDTAGLFGLADRSVKTLKPKLSRMSDGSRTLSVYSKELQRSFTSQYKSLFTRKLDANDMNLDYLDYDAEWLMWSNLSDKEFLGHVTNLDGNLAVDVTNLPALERILHRHSSYIDLGKVTVRMEDGTSVNLTRDMILDNINEIKQDLWMKLSLQGVNEQSIAKMLNVDIDVTTGVTTPESWIQNKSFTSPELVVVDHKPVSMHDIEMDSRSIVQVEQNRELLQHQKEKVSAELLGTAYTNTPELSMDELAWMSPLESRTTLISNARSIFGSIREKMQFIGKQTADQKSRMTKQVHEEFAAFNRVFSRQGNAGLRMELALSENYARERWYVMVKSVDANGNEVRTLVDKDALSSLDEKFGFGTVENPQTFMGMISESGAGEFDVTQFEGLNDLIQGMVGQGKTAAGAPTALNLSDDVAKLWQLHMRRNAEIVRKKQLVAGAEGGDFVADPNVLYPPPKDLTREKYFGFVVPKTFTEGSDPRKYMVYGRTEQELQAKIGQIKDKYGDKYEIYSNPAVQEYKKYVGEYSRGDIFDEIYFDAGLKRSGSAAELVPNLDLNVTSTLDRMVSWNVRQEHALIRKGVELKYAEQIQTLRNYDEVISEFVTGRADKRHAEISSIARDSVDMMLDIRRGDSGGRLEDLWVKVNDYIGEKGSALIDEAFGTLRGKRVSLNQAELNAFNAKLESQGFSPPFKDLFEAIAASPDPGVSRTLANAVRTLNNLAGTLMLRMDWAHSIIQLLSTPILMLPVLLEAKAALKGTDAGKRLDDLTSVVNPHNGMAEPSAMKLFFSSMKNFWSPEGKEFIKELRRNNVLTDYLVQYGDVHDFSQLTGRHTLHEINNQIDKLAQFGSKWSGFTASEEFTRFMVADAVRQIAEVRGIHGAERMALISSAVDKVHGVYLGNQRPQLFRGTLGQAIGLYQTYFFNFAQNAMKWVGDGNKREAIALATLQSSIFGLQSWPGFNAFNRWIGEANRDNTDIYSITNADDPSSLGAYALFGLGSHALGVPIDFYTRGDLAIRNTTVVANPMNPMEIPAVDLLAKAVSNMVGVARYVAEQAAGSETSAPPMEALLHGLAHNGMNRPLQGLGTILRGRVTSGYGQVYFQNSNYVDHNASEEYDWGRMFARLIGSRPLDESIIMNNYFRQKGYQANVRKEISELGESLQLTFADGNPTKEQYNSFAVQYERKGGDIQNFNAYFARQFQASGDGVMQTFHRELQADTEFRRARDRMLIKQSSKPVWEY